MKIQQQKFGRRTVALFWLGLAAIIIGTLIYLEQIAVLYVLATVSLVLLLLIVAFAEHNFEADPFEDLPYDDSRRLPTSHAFDDDKEAHAEAQATAARNSRTRMIGSVLQSFLQSDTGKVLVAQAGAVALALVTKKLGEFFPAAKNSDLAASPGNAPAASGDSPVASSAPSVSSDASNPPQSL